MRSHLRGLPSIESGPPPEDTDVVHSAARGVVAAMSMTGMRALTTTAGLIQETPPEMVAEEKAPAPIQRLPARAYQSFIVLAHWGYGAGGGAVFGFLPQQVRRTRWCGPLYGLVLWLIFEVLLEPVLGLRKRGFRPIAERAAFAADHMLYGFVLAETRSRPRK